MSNCPAQPELSVADCPGQYPYSFGYLQGWTLHNLSGQPVPVLSHSYSEEIFPDVQAEPSVFQCVHINSCAVTGHH